MKKIILNIFFIFLAANLIAQTYQMPSSGYLEINTDQGIIYDDGGENQNYSTRINSIVTIYPTTPGATIRISGDYFLEDHYKSIIRFYNGDTNSTWELASVYNSGCITVKANTGPLTIRFIADTETPEAGFEFSINACPDKANNINSFNISDSSSEINWHAGNDSTNWIIEYNTWHFSLGQGIRQSSDTNYIKLEELNSCTDYYYYILTDFDIQEPLCSHYAGLEINHFRTTNELSPLAYDLEIEATEHSLEFSWSETDTNTTWFVYLTNASSSYTDTIITNNPNCIFDSLLSGEPYHIEISSTQALGTNCKLKQHWIHTLCACPKANNIIITEIQPNEATLEWDRDTNATGWIVQYKMRDYPNDSLLTIITYTNSITLEDLIPVRPYIVIVNSYCDSLRSHCSNTFEFFTSIFTIECITFTDLKDLNFIPTFGNYEDPYSHNGLIDYGYNSSQSRHTIHYDTAQKDERTNNLLSTIPLGELASFRLGNWLPGAEAESCTFAYYVDTNNFDMFLLKYAIVLEDPNHNQAQQPRFTLEIMDTNYVLFDEECGYTDFYASGDLNWNTVEGSTVIWKDWTSIGIDLSSYHNQKIFVRFTTYDCDEGGHFGYAYFNLKCDNRYTNKEFCGENDTLIFEAPLGFDYLWYNINNPEDTLSTSRELSVLVNNNTYICKCSNKENSNCNFNLTFIAEKRYPFPQFDNIEDTCGYKVYFYNKSIISSNDSIGIGDEKCLDIKWIFHDGSISFEQNPVFTYDSSGVYPVILIAKINDGICVDTLYKNIHIDISGIKTIIFSGDTIICRGSEVKISVNEFDSYLWINNDTTKTIIVSPLETTKYFIQVSDNGCIRYDSITIYVEPYYYMDTLFGVICRGASYNQNDFNENKEGFYTRIYTAYNGCDSIRNLVLKVVDKIYDYSVINLESNIIEELPIKLSAYCEYCNNYYWSTGSKDSVIDAYNYGNYFVRMDHVCGKIYDSILIISPEVNIYVPNAFTPNEAQNNNFFPIFEDNNTLKIQSFEIYNRWGENIYSSDKTPWNGMYNNNNCQPGVYIWRLLYTTKYTGKKVFEMKGEVNLLR